MAEIEEYNLLDNELVIVERGDSQRWTALGSRYDADACGRLFDIVENCDAPPGDQLEPPLGAAAPGYDVRPFGLIERQQSTVLCDEKDLEEVARALDNASSFLVADVLWNGPTNIQTLNPNWDQLMYLTSTEVATVTGPPATPTSDWLLEAALAKLLEQAFARHPDLEAQHIIHLGLQAGFALSGPIKRLGLNVVISGAYPSLGMAITGPIEIRLGNIDPQKNQNGVYRDNKIWISASRFAAFAFDPCLALLMDYS